MTDKTLQLSDRSKLKYFEKSAKYYLNKTTIIYGRTNSGKTTIIDEVMFLLKPHIPLIFVVAPTNASNNAYTDKIPPQCIFKELDVNWLEKLLTRQKNSAGAYINANKLPTLKALFDMVSDSSSRSIELSIIKKAANALIYLDECVMDFSSKKLQKSQILVERDVILKKIYKTSIRYNKVNLENDKALTKSQKAALAFLDFNPNIVLILDDCASKFKMMAKKSTAIKEIFYEGRHYFITLIISAQDDKEIDSELRKNTTVSMFTTAQSATSNFERTSNGYPKHEKLMAKLCTDTIFKQDSNDLTHFRKFVYIQNESNPFCYTIADLYDDFTMGSSPLWDFSNRIGKKSDTVDKNNKLVDFYL
jgi:hypothetical protein